MHFSSSLFIILFFPLSASATGYVISLTGCLVVFAKYSPHQFALLYVRVFVPFSTLSTTCAASELLWRVLFSALAQITFSHLSDHIVWIRIYMLQFGDHKPCLYQNVPTLWTLLWRVLLMHMLLLLSDFNYALSDCVILLFVCSTCI